MENQDNDPHRAFLCHSTADWEFVCQVKRHLERHLDGAFCFEQYHDASQDFTAVIDEQLKCCGILVVFVGDELTGWQRMELETHVRLCQAAPDRRDTVIVSLMRIRDSRELPDGFPGALRGRPFLPFDSKGSPATCVRRIVEVLEIPWVSDDDDLPFNPQVFSYEKDVISFYVHKRELAGQIKAGEPVDREDSRRIRAKLEDGCPVEWPQVVRWEGDQDNPLPSSEIGEYRPDDARVLPAALTKLQQDGSLLFLEAGPRRRLYYPRPSRGLNVAILVSGGIAPGINAVIDGIVQRHSKYKEGRRHTLQIRGLHNGFHAFDDLYDSTSLLFPNADSAAGHPEGLVTSLRANEGGSMLQTSRVEELISEETRREQLQKIVAQLADVDILYVIGGDGSMKAAHAIWSVARTVERADRRLSVVAIPKTMDNDILWVWQSFGFLSAVQRAKEIVDQIHTECSSNPRVCVVQLFGSDSGFVVSHAALASATGQCDVALIPEVKFSMLGLAMHLKERICSMKRRIPHALVVLAETAIPVDALECLGDRESHEHGDFYAAIQENLGLTTKEQDAIREFDRLRADGMRIQGQTSDDLRRAGLRIVMEALPILLEKMKDVAGFHPSWDRLRVFSNEPRHLLRAIEPSTSDILMAQRLGVLAVDNAMAGYTDFMISQWLTEFVLVPLKLAVLGRKRIPDSGIFWKSVLAKTGQPPDLVAPWTPPADSTA